MRFCIALGGQSREPRRQMMPESKLTAFRNAFLSGLILLAPLGVTWMVFAWLIETVGGGVGPIFFPHILQTHPSIQFAWNILCTLIVIALITGLGWLSRYVFGQYFGGLAERFVQSIPGVNTVYNTVKQIVETFGPNNRSQFSQVVLVEFPRKGCWTLGFLTNKQQGEPQRQLPTETWSVFVPTSPNPTSGYLLLVPKAEIIELSMSVGDGMKMVISGGAVLPATPLKSEP